MKNVIKLKINSFEVTAEKGKTILEIARDNNIEIPAMCSDDRLEPFGSCGICSVEIEGSPRLFRACSTVAGDGMSIHTETERVRKNRKTALELLLSDHKGDCRPPCSVACPADTDCRGYAKLIAVGDYSGAWDLIREKLPFPSSVGRVCPRPCEEACRRQLVEEPIAIAALKAFAGDKAGVGGVSRSNAKPPSGKTVAVIGGGPAGLSAAYYLRLKGHDVTVFEAQPEMGGMLRYGIPEYRLPKSILKREIDLIENAGVVFCNNVKVELDSLRGKYGAVVVAVGAWSSSGLRCKGEDLDGVIPGIDFLHRVAAGNPPDISGKRVAVVGGGNTAMDVCRTAVRLGADVVYNIYRRTKNEMPAEEIEITEAEEEGVVFKNLTNPSEIIGENKKVSAVRLQIMELGEPDASGRRAPVPVDGAEETLKVDVVFSAIGQKPALDGLGGLATTRWGTVVADGETFSTNLDGVFAIGDATNDGADIAVSAIGEGRRCAAVIDGFLSGGDLSGKTPYIVKDEKTADDFIDVPRQPRVQLKYRRPSERRGDFREVNAGFTEEQARAEATRCLECGCSAYRECKLIKYANVYEAVPDRFSGVKSGYKVERDDHAEIIRNPEKCVLCGLCVRVCGEVEGKSALGFSGRGFTAEIKPALRTRLRDTDCNSCGKCAEVCPTGALTVALTVVK